MDPSAVFRAQRRAGKYLRPGGTGIAIASQCQRAQAIPAHYARSVRAPDEEIGGHDGMEKFVQTDKFRALNVGFALDEGLWHSFNTFKRRKCKISTEIFIGGTDSRYLRQAGIPAIGFSPMINTPILLHDHNEFLNEHVFLDGVKLYAKIIPRLANLKAENTRLRWMGSDEFEKSE
ncbi:hypothetical protein niasHS_007689 [Heterodera schachtii]|uniref:Aminoacylase-1 n=1 Tax=Heterodera schachtii TaxID=97005 RepID=A0ABD2JPD2_HETSC